MPKTIEKIIQGLELVVEGLKELDKPVQKIETPKVQETETLNQTVSLEEVRAVLAQKSGEGKGSEVRSLLKKYGAEKLSALEEKYYFNVKTEAEAL